MTAPFIKLLKNVPTPSLYSGYLYDDTVINKFQRECITVLSRNIQFEHQSYVAEHPEVCAMLSICVGNAIRCNTQQETLAFLSKHFTRPAEELEKEVRTYLNVSPDAPYFTGKHNVQDYTKNLMTDLWQIRAKFNQEPSIVLSSEVSSITTKSSSFISLVTSETTLATPEPSPVRSPTTSEIFYGIISKAVDKATTIGLNDAKLLYDAAYVAIMKAVEEAMDITVIDIKKDIEDMIECAYQMFSTIIIERAKIVAEKNWEKRMRKKLKRTLRRAENFRGYVTPPTPKSSVSSHESYKKPPPPPCQCHPQWHYNRYPKDRFGLYLPQDVEYSSENITVTPVFSMTKVEDKDKTKQDEGKKKVIEIKTTVLPTHDQNESSNCDTDETHAYTSTDCDEISIKKEENIIVASTKNGNIKRIKSFDGSIKETNDQTKEEKDIYTERLKMLTFIKKAEVIAPPLDESKLSANKIVSKFNLRSETKNIMVSNLRLRSDKKEPKKILPRRSAIVSL